MIFRCSWTLIRTLWLLLYGTGMADDMTGHSRKGNESDSQGTESYKPSTHQPSAKKEPVNFGATAKRMQELEHLHSEIRVYSHIKKITCQGEAVFALGQMPSNEVGWYVDVPEEGQGAGCEPQNQTIRDPSIIPFIKRGGCSFVDKAINSGAYFSIIYDYKDKDPKYMTGFGK